MVGKLGGKPLLGAHMSIAGGFYRAVERAAEAGCDCVQIFTTSPRSWPPDGAPARGGPPVRKQATVTEADAAAFQQALSVHAISHPIAHASYLMNLASPDRALWERSHKACTAELRRAEILGIPYLVLHPGAYISGSESAGLDRIVAAVGEALTAAGPSAAGLLLETTAGQGTSLGHRFEHLSAIIQGVGAGDRLGVCFDTCHVFAAGYDLTTRKGYLDTWRRFDRTVGLDALRAFHLNDSQRSLGSRVDRHAHIGRGAMGLEPFRQLLGDRRFREIPMYLETPKGTEGGVDLDKKNLLQLRRLLQQRPSRRGVRN